MNEPQGRMSNSVGAGIGVTLFLHGLAAALLMVYAWRRGGDETAGLGPFVFIGAAQFLWMFPACLVAVYLKLHRTLLGMGIGVAITILLNAACFGVIMINGFG